MSKSQQNEQNIKVTNVQTWIENNINEPKIVNVIKITNVDLHNKLCSSLHVNSSFVHRATQYLLVERHKNEKLEQQLKVNCM